MRGVAEGRDRRGLSPRPVQGTVSVERSALNEIVAGTTEIGDILAEVQGLAASGVVEVTLLGQNVNAYARSGTGPIKAVARGETAVSLSFVHDEIGRAHV